LSNPYIAHRIPSYAGARPEAYIAVSRFAADLAQALGYAPDPGPDDATGWNNVAGFTADAGLRVSVHAKWNADGRVILDAGLPAEQRRAGYHVKFPSITVDVSRPIGELARDVRRRLIDRSAAPAAQMREHDAMITARRADLIAHAEALRALHPAMTVKIPDDPGAFNAPFHLATGVGAFFTGKLNVSGALTFDRVGARDVAQAAAILAAAMAPPAGEN
jgi:hypothetical protein